jgi:hypothetical protein
VPPPPPGSPLLGSGEAAQRHGCLTAWLIFMIIANAATAVLTPLSVGGMKQAGLNISPLMIGLIVICAIVNIACAIALFRWKKWGFYGSVATAVIALIINIAAGLGVAQSLAGLIGIGILYWVLNMGGEKKAWPRLK